MNRILPSVHSRFLLFSLLGTLALLSSCQEKPSSTPSESLCGKGGIAVSYGYGKPFESLDRNTLLIEYGLQGGYHIDVSLRFTGAFDPDLVDVKMDLSITNVDHTDGIIGRHDTQAWYLLFPSEKEEQGCYFHRARIFLFDGNGDIPTESMVSMLDGMTAKVNLTLTTSEQMFETSETFPLHFIPPSP